MGALEKTLKKLVSEGYKLKAQHNNSEWKQALEDAEQILISKKELSIDNFKTELKELLERYNASIGCDIDGDTHGISTTMVVEIGKKDHILGYSSYIDWSDLK